MQKKYIIIPAIILLAILVAVLSLRGDHKTSSPLVIVTEGDITSKVTAIGYIVSSKTAAIKSPVSGIVAQLFHGEEEAVKKGDPLLLVKPQPTPKEYVTAKQTVETDLVNEEAALIEVKRYESLFQDGGISKNNQDYLNALTDYKKIQLQRQLDQEVLALLEEGKATVHDKSISNVVYSPIDGFIVERAVNIGDPVLAQTDYQAGNVLFTVADMNSLIFKGQVSETDAAKLGAGVTATIKLAALPDLTIKGTLTQLGLQSTQLATPLSSPNPANAGGTGNTNANNSPFNVGYKVEISDLTIPSNIQLRAGYSATAEIVVATVQHALIIPERILQFENDKPYVWRADKKRPAKQFVMVGLSDGVNVQVLTGLKAGEKLLEIPPDDDHSQNGVD